MERLTYTVQNMLVQPLHSPAARAIAGVFLLSILIKIVVLILLVGSGGTESLILGDSKHYLALADSVVAGDGYVYKGHAETYRPPGYPTFLGFFEILHIPLWVASLLQLILASLLPALVVWLGIRYLSLPVRWAAAAGVLAAIEPVQTYYGVVLMPDVLFALGIVGAFVLLVRWYEHPSLRAVALAGLLVGLANYVRPALTYFPLFFILGAGFWLLVTRSVTKQRLVHLGIFLVVPFLVMAPWYIHNYVKHGVLEFVSVKAYTLYTYGAASAQAIATGVSYEGARVPLVEQARKEAPSQNLEGFEDEAYLSHAAQTIIKRYPLEFLQSYLLGLNTFWFSGNYHYLLFKYGFISPPETQTSFSLLLATHGVMKTLGTIIERLTSPYLLIAIGGKVLWVLLGLLAFAGLVVHRKNPLALATLLLAAYSCATVIATTIGVEARHRYYLNPLIFLFFVATLYSFYVFYHRRHSHTERSRNDS